MQETTLTWDRLGVPPLEENYEVVATPANLNYPVRIESQTYHTAANALQNGIVADGSCIELHLLLLEVEGIAPYYRVADLKFINQTLEQRVAELERIVAQLQSNSENAAPQIIVQRDDEISNYLL